MISQETMSILVVHLSRNTNYAETNGADHEWNTVYSYRSMLAHALSGKCYIAETSGDHLLILSLHPEDLAISSLNLLQLTQYTLKQLVLSAGLHHGVVSREKDKFFGSNLNLATRLASTAMPNQILCSISFIEKTIPNDTFHFGWLGAISFENMPHPMMAGELMPSREAASQTEKDPTCHSRVDASTPYFTIKDNTTYYFCSANCRDLFEGKKALSNSNT